MDYALLAATALGAIGLYLMLPRERAPWARLGLLLGAMALAGLFLFLVRVAQHGMGGGGSGDGPPVYFYIFAGIMIAAAVAVVCQSRPVYAALYFVLVTLAGAGLFVLLLAEFMAIVLIIIYAGAILVTYVFVIMLASQGSTGGNVTSPAYDRRSVSGCVAVLVAFVLMGTAMQALLPRQVSVVSARWGVDDTWVDVTKTVQGKIENGRLNFTADNATFSASNVPTGKPRELELTYQFEDQPQRTQTYKENSRISLDHLLGQLSSSNDPTAKLMVVSQNDNSPVSNVQVLGTNLYSRYGISLELAGILLTIALIGAVVIARKNTQEHQALGTGAVPTE